MCRRGVCTTLSEGSSQSTGPCGIACRRAAIHSLCPALPLQPRLPSHPLLSLGGSAAAHQLLAPSPSHGGPEGRSQPQQPAADGPGHRQEARQERASIHRCLAGAWRGAGGPTCLPPAAAAAPSRRRRGHLSVDPRTSLPQAVLFGRHTHHEDRPVQITAASTVMTADETYSFTAATGRKRGQVLHGLSRERSPSLS